MGKTNVAFIYIFLFLVTIGTFTISHLYVSTNQDQIIISLKNSFHISQSCFSSFALYMIKIS